MSNRSPSTYKQAQVFKQHTHKLQALLMGQHYSNNITMILLSTLESLQMAYCNIPLKKEDKLYSYYDKVDYQDKAFQELKSQLQTHLRVMKASRQLFTKENPKSKYIMPESFNEQRLKCEIGRLKQVFSKEKDIFSMLEDLEKISQGQIHATMYFETHDFSVKYSAREAEKHQKDILRRGIHANREMQLQKEQLDILSIKQQKYLPINLNNRSNNHYRPVQR